MSPGKEGEEEIEMFDEFGNPLNGSSDDSSDSDLDVSMVDDSHSNEKEPQEQSDAIVLSEDKRYYPTISSTFDADVETIIATVDEKTLKDPIVQAQIEKNFTIEEETLPETSYSKQYMWETTGIPERIRNVALCGNIHAGKTSVLDMFVNQTHTFNSNGGKTDRHAKNEPLRYTDNTLLEVKRGISIKSTVLSMLLPDLSGKSTVVNFIDSPGHNNFCDEMTISIKMADIVMLCVDVVEGATRSLELAIEYSLKTHSKLVLMLTKIDRLILELRLPPLDAYYKIRRSIGQVNEIIEQYCKILDIDFEKENLKLSPELNNVCFSSSVFNMIFTLESFTKKYFGFHNLDRKDLKLTVDSFARKLWGDIYYDNKKFFVRPKNPLALASSRTFIKFILTPIYKLATTSLSLDPPERQKFVEEHMKLKLKKDVYKLDSKPFLKEIFQAFFGLPSVSFVSVLNQVSSPLDNSKIKLNDLYTGPPNQEVSQLISDCDKNNKVVAYVGKLVDTRDSENFYALVRVLSGCIKQNQLVKLLGTAYSPNSTDDCKEQKISKCYMWCGRYKVEVPELRAGSIGLISGPGIDNFIVKSATIYDQTIEEPLYILKGADRLFPPVFKVAVQAYNPKDLNQFLDSLKKLNKSYAGCEITVEDSGEYSILGFGELYMDCLLHDLRILYGGIDIKVSDPMVKFNETSAELSKIKLVTKSNNGKSSISIIAEPLNPDISRDIKNGTLSIKRDPPRTLAKKLRDKYEWDSFAARSVWSFGPDETGTCLFCDDTLPSEVDKKLLNRYKPVILKGFQWAVKEGPLCEEPVSDVKFSIIDVNFAEEESDRNDAQIIQMIRKACNAALLIGSPKLLEPIYQIETICHTDILQDLDKLIDRRRGFTIDKDRIDGTSLWRVNSLIPVIESVGIETDIRLATHGMAYPQMVFSKWDLVPGNPLDDTAFIPLLKRAPLLSSSRDFMMKTRRRKGLTDEVSLRKYVDPETWNMLSELGVV